MAARAAAASMFIGTSGSAQQVADPHGEGLREHLLTRWGEGKVAAQDRGEGGEIVPPSPSHQVGVESIGRR
eukprot:9473232-Pyramimonas_sp.AAC.2